MFKHSIKVYDKALQRAFISKLLRNPVYVQADMDIYEYFKAQGVKIESPRKCSQGTIAVISIKGREGEEPILVIAPHQGAYPLPALADRSAQALTKHHIPEWPEMP